MTADAKDFSHCWKTPESVPGPGQHMKVSWRKGTRGEEYKGCHIGKCPIADDKGILQYRCANNEIRSSFPTSATLFSLII